MVASRPVTSPPLARRLSAIQPSATLAISERAAALRQKGVDVISFGVGEPDFPTPAHVRQAGKDAIDRGETRYTAVRGIPKLIDAILADSRRRRGIEHGRREVVVSTGAKHSLYNLSVALFEPGDEVIVPAPYWVSYPEQVALAGATVRSLPTTAAEGFLVSPAALREAIGERTRAIILCSPSNPTGAAYSEAQLRGLAAVLRERDVWVIVDEIYGQLVYDGFRQTSLAGVAPELRERLIIVDGASKTYAMTGWRIGWILAPEGVAEACERVQSQSTSNACSIAQHATVAALDGAAAHAAELEQMIAEFSARRRLMVDGLNAIPGVACRMPEGAFYAFPSVAGLLGRRTPDGKTLETDLDVCDFLLDAARIALVPGTAFGAPAHVRLSYATSRALVSEGLSRMDAAVRSLSAL